MSNRPRLAQIGPSGATNGQLARYNSTTENWEPYSFPLTKSGHALASSFSGNPKRATVTYPTAFPSGTDISVTATSVTSNGKTFAIAIENPTLTNFVVNMGTNIITDLVQVNWRASKEGEAP